MSPSITESRVNRNIAIDIAKGLLMLFVVITHAGSDFNKYLLWFHTPGFFLISGFFFRPANDPGEVKKTIRRLLPVFFIPYFVYLFLLDAPLLFHLIRNAKWPELWSEISLLLYGGRKLQGIYAAFWFVPVLFFSRMIVTFLSVYLSETKIFIILFMLFLLGALESFYFHTTGIIIDFPLNLDVVLTAAFYYFAGYLLYKHAGKINLKLYFALLLLCAMIVWGDLSGFYTIAVDMKYSVYYQPLQVLAVSLLFPFVIYQSSVFLSRIAFIDRIFSLIGIHSLTVMYLHVFVNIMIMHTFSVSYNAFTFTFTGIVLPLMFALLVNRWSITRSVFTGSRHKKE